MHDRTRRPPSRPRAGQRFGTTLALVLAAMTSPLRAAVPEPPTAPAAQLALRWEVETFQPGRPPGRPVARAVFTVTNKGPAPLPATGWALYFTSISAVRPIPQEDRDTVEHVTGILFRVRAAAGTGPLAPGQTLRLPVEHTDLVLKNSKGPTGPYIVFDRAPGTAAAISDYESVPFPRLDRLPGLPEPVSTRVSPEETYARNAGLGEMASSRTLPLLPTPARVEFATGRVTVGPGSEVLAAAGLTREKAAAKTLLARFPSGGAGAYPRPVRLEIGAVPGQTSPEAYRLTADPATGLTITGASAAGVFYGLQSLAQLGPEVPALTLTDGPRFAYRGLMLDVARNFQGRDKVLAVLDLMARFKLNRLHLHFADDEGWRIAIRGLPELTTLGARRGHSATPGRMLPPAYGSGPDPEDRHGSGFYSRADYVAILRHARDRHIEVIPELEMPGHARAAARAMEARAQARRRRHLPGADRYLLTDPQDQSTYSSAQLYSDNVINPGLPSTYVFLDHVIAELARMHRAAGLPLRTLHVGGDELAAGAWEKSPAALREMQRLGVTTTADLWDAFYDRVADIARRHGATLAGWEELGVRKATVDGRPTPAPNPHFLRPGIQLQVWNNLRGSEDLAYRLANAGYPLVLSPATNLYFDMAHSRDALEPGHSWAAFTELADVHGFDPFHMTRDSRTPGLVPLSDQGRDHILGLEGTLFSETLRDPARLDDMMAPRILALAERAWAPAPAWTITADAGEAARLRAQDWSAFSRTLGQHVLPGLDRDLPGLAYRIPPPGLVVKDGQVLANHAYPGFTLRYTVGGAQPDGTSPEVTGPISAHGRITVAAFSSRGRAGPAAAIDNP